MAHGKPDLEALLNLHILKKAELEVDAHKLEKDLFFWGGVYEEIKFVNHQWKMEEKGPSTENLPYSQFRRMAKPSLLSGMPVHAESTIGRILAPETWACRQAFPGKQFPIEEMLAKFRTTSLNL